MGNIKSRFRRKITRDVDDSDDVIGTKHEHRVDDEQAADDRTIIATNISNLRGNLSLIIETQYGLIDTLRPQNTLTAEQLELIDSKTTLHSVVGQLLDDVVKLSRDQQEQFLVALESTHQKHVASYIRASGLRTTEDKDNWPLQFDGRETHHTMNAALIRLIELIDSRNGLIDELYSVNVISGRQKRVIEARETDDQKNELLLFILQRGSIADYESFIACLLNTKQHQVVYLLEPSVAGHVRPLNERHSTRLKVNHRTLISLIDTRNGLLEEMWSTDCITRRQKEFVEAAATQSESNSRLLDIVRRGSESDFDKFIECLGRTGQQHVGGILLKD